MISRKIKLLMAAVSLVALATTVGFASTMHTHAKAAHQMQGSSGKAVGCRSAKTPRRTMGF